MINGKASRTMYYGAFALLAFIIAAITALSIGEKPVPSAFDTVIAAILAYIAGAHIKPPVDPTGKAESGEEES